MEGDKGQNNTGRTDRGLGSFEAPAPLDFFSNAPTFAFFYKKCEKIVTALYMISGLLSDSEPLKWRVRNLGAEILSLANHIKDKFSTERGEVVHGIRSHILELSSLLDIAKYAGLISEMNAGILNDELQKLGEMLEGGMKFESNSGSLLIDRSFFASPKPIDENTAASSAFYPDRRPSPVSPKGQKNNSLKKGPSRAPSLPKLEKKGHRRDAILAIIKRKGEVTIKDVSLNMQEVSEKTIQRELLSLVEEGVLKKEGERRWSRYSLAS